MFSVMTPTNAMIPIQGVVLLTESQPDSASHEQRIVAALNGLKKKGINTIQSYNKIDFLFPSNAGFVFKETYRNGFQFVEIRRKVGKSSTFRFVGCLFIQDEITVLKLL